MKVRKLSRIDTFDIMGILLILWGNGGRKISRKIQYLAH